MATAVIYVFDYIFGIPIFGFMWWLLNGILVEIKVVSATGDVLTLANYFWTAALIIYILFGAFWLPRKIKEWEVFR